MSIYEDARKGLLVGSVLDAYIENKPNTLDEQSPDTGLTALAIAAIEGFPDEVEQLLKKGAGPDALSSNLETPLLLAAWKGKKERARIIQLLLKSMPPGSLNRTCKAADFNTPLMFAIKNKDYESIRLLVIYCDDSTTMKREGRWESQKELVQRIAKITTMVLPRNEGVTLRFINRNVENSDNLTLEHLGNLLKGMDWQPGGDTAIGTNLRSKILQPLVYRKLEDGTLERPVLVIIMTDGMPEREDRTELEKAILECEKKIQESGYPPQSMYNRFL
ncbi:hypothetical protein TrVGV298_010726 [Trichoderma virens]|nr:hypothetical protein TrVGV298_010726 [Trichoderma virens]